MSIIAQTLVPTTHDLGQFQVRRVLPPRALFRGAIDHRDSLGTCVTIRPGQVNLMTAGRGIGGWRGRWGCTN
ncbi:MAG: pirin family protein [Qipengyuania sp.]